MCVCTLAPHTHKTCCACLLADDVAAEVATPTPTPALSFEFSRDAVAPSVALEILRSVCLGASEFVATAAYAEA